MVRPPRVFRGRRPVRPPRQGGLTLNKMLPNILTLLALSAGMTGMRFGIQGRWEEAVVSILIAAVLDALDGRIARLLNAQSKFGAELDSLSDVISFGVAPAMILYMWVLDEARSFGWIAAVLFGVCAALRLARFNTALGVEKPAWAFNYFTGVPAPAGAGLALLPLIASFEVGPTVFGHPVFVTAWTVGIAALMISAIPTYSLKGVRIPRAYVVFVLVGVGLLAAGVVSAPWTTFTVIAIVYLASFPFSIRQYHRLKSEAERLQAAEEPPAADPADPAAGAPPAPTPSPGAPPAP
ncbi:MAG TPA: CDP-diacylglycerol--serine O-phosphatidyltransferase [Azospirillaceae bacterium]|nr:CDP-diacylglycerol--serine O-phosphatidyltransferase [Azospirillaceae bacterium]